VLKDAAGLVVILTDGMEMLEALSHIRSDLVTGKVVTCLCALLKTLKSLTSDEIGW
jgi:hypothetical protein